MINHGIEPQMEDDMDFNEALTKAKEANARRAAALAKYRDLGRRAFSLGQSRKSCALTVGSPARRAWVNGWDAALAETKLADAKRRASTRNATLYGTDRPDFLATA